MVGTKRRRDDDEVEAGTPQTLRARIADDEDPTPDAQTPSRRGRPHLLPDGTPRSILKKSGLSIVSAITPKSNRKLVFETPTKSAKSEPNGTPTIVRNADL
jgi:origin recognition complex subunit 2